MSHNDQWPRDIPMLYEGNYSEWHTIIEGRLAAQGLSHLAQSSSPTDNTSKYRFWAQSRDVAKHLRNFFSPTLLEHIPGKHQQKMYKLLSTLRVLAQPFKSIALPKDVRLCVYDHIATLYPGRVCLARSRVQGNKIIQGRRERHIPAVAYANSVLRGETREIFAKKATFCLLRTSDDCTDNTNQVKRRRRQHEPPQRRSQDLA